MKNAAICLLIGLLALGSGLARAGMEVVDQTGAQALECLQRNGAALQYRERDLQHRISGKVRVALRFRGPDSAPDVEVLYRAASDGMVDDVREHVQAYRLPCFKAGGAPIAIVQEFEYEPVVTEPISWTTPRAVADRSATGKTPEHLAACIRTPANKLELADPMLRQEVTNAIVQLTFVAPDAPPLLKVKYSSFSSRHAKALEKHLQQYRLPCLGAADEPVTTEQHFSIWPEGMPHQVFKDAVSLTSFLSNIRGIDKMRTDFDFNTMGCPFQLAWRLGKPAVENDVGEVGALNLNRAEFMAWMAGLQMDVDKRQFQKLLGRKLIVDVPCGVLRLEPGS